VVPSSAERAASGLLDGEVVGSPLAQRQIRYVLPLAALPDVQATHGVLHTGYYLELLARAARRCLGAEVDVPAIAFTSALVVQEDRDTTVVLTLDEDAADGTASFAFHRQDPVTGEWTSHAHGTARTRPAAVALGRSQAHRDPAAGRPGHLLGTEFYAGAARERRLDLGADVQLLAELWTGPGRALARLACPPALEHGGPFALGVPPAVLDACAQLAHAALPDGVEDDARFMVTSWTDVAWQPGGAARELWCEAVSGGYDRRSGELRCAFELFDEEGTVLARVGAGVMKGIRAVHEQAFQEITTGGTDGGQPAGQPSAILRQLGATPPERRAEELTAYLRQTFAELLRMDAAELGPTESLADLGMDSLVGVAAQRALGEALSASVPIASLLEGPSVRELAASLLPSLSIPAPAAAPAAAAAPPGPTRWIALRRPNPAARMKLFCLPYGRGKGASVFRDWQRLLGDAVEVCPVQLPGKESRIKEPAFEDITAATDALAEALAPELDRPYALYGHSVGGLLAYRLAYRLWQTEPVRPAHLFVGAYSAPPVHPNPMITLTRGLFAEEGFADIPAPGDLPAAGPERFRAILRVMSSEADLTGDLAETLLPSRLAELKLVQSYTFDGSRFDVPVTAFHGLRDDRVDEAHMLAWEQATDGPFRLRLLSGDHLFLSEDQDQALLLRYIAEELGL
jgi:surfactin synthase thioesterase subunit